MGSTQFDEGYFEFAGHQLHYVEAGDGETVLFLHGFPSFWLSLNHQMRHLARDFHVIAIDGLGVGKSSAPNSVDAYTLEKLSAHINALLDEKGVSQVHIVGHDWGAALALGIAQRHPGRVQTVTAMSGPPQTVILELISQGPTEADRFAYVELLKRANPPLLTVLGATNRVYDSAYAPLVSTGAISRSEGEVFRVALKSPKRLNAHINWYRANIPSPDDIVASSYWPHQDARIEAPVLFIWGENDPIISDSAINMISQLSDDVTLLSFPDSGHWPHMERRDDVNEAIMGFIDVAR
ncbi:MAG: alpha/beta hydrolase [Pseudomonadota bacterium]